MPNASIKPARAMTSCTRPRTPRLVRTVHEAEALCDEYSEPRAKDRDDRDRLPVRRLHPDLPELVRPTERHRSECRKRRSRSSPRRPSPSSCGSSRTNLHESARLTPGECRRPRPVGVGMRSPFNSCAMSRRSSRVARVRGSARPPPRSSFVDARAGRLARA
jgi:hypothetical protein